MWDGQTDDYRRFTSWVDSLKPDVCVWCEAQMQSLFNNQLQVLVEALQYHLRLVSSVDDLMAIEVEESVWSEG